ncbi:MAG TPA: hypothetical protein VFW03_11085 [Gemmatimonadaceae bacterium]|nr:hypothetical protein [Gemmatimonadaceae bacterium]
MTVIDLVDRERGRISRLIAAAGGAAAVGLAALLLAAGVVLLGRARWIDLPRVVPFVVWLAVAIVAIAAVWWTRRRLARDASVSGLAFEVEREQSLRAGAVRGALEVASSGTLGRYNAEQVARRLKEKAGSRSLTPTLTRRAVVRSGGAAVVGALGILLLATRSSATPDGWRAIAHPVRAWTGTLLAPIEFQRAPKTVLRGERLTLSISAPERRRVTLYQRAKGSAWRASEHEVRDGVAKVRLAPMDADLTLFATDGRTVSDTASVALVERPFIGDISVTATFPRYLDRRDETLPVGEAAQLPRGTVLTISGHSSTELSRVSLARARDTLRLTPNGRSFTGRLPVVEGGRYEWSAAGLTGPITELPAALEFEVVPDSVPHIEILAPATDTTVSAGDTIPMSFLATDDHGLASVVLRAWRQPEGGTAMPETKRPLLSQPSTQWTGNAVVSLPALGVQPGEAVHLVAVAIDGSPWHQSGSTRELVLRVPGLTEARANVRAAADSAVERAKAAAAAQKALQQRTADAARARQRNIPKNGDRQGSSNKSSMSYEAAQQAQALAKEQRELAERMQQLQQNAQQIEKQLKQSNALDSALSARLQEAQKLLRDALTPELAEKLRKLEESAQKLSAEDAQKALGDLAQQQKGLREQLEKSVEMLKRAALEGSMQTLKEEAKDLAKAQRANADSMAKARDQAQKQEAQNNARDLADRSRDLQKQVEELQKRLERENADAGAQRVNDANQQVKESAQAMERAARNQAPDQRRGESQQQKDQRAQQDMAQQMAQAAQRQNGQQQNGQQQNGQQQNAQGNKSQDKDGQAQKGQEKQDGQPGAQKQGQESQQSQQGQTGQPGQQGQKSDQQSGQQQGGQQQSGQQSGGQQSGGQQSANDAADAMQKAADQLADARQKQIDAWKQELTGELDQSIQEMLQLSRQQEQLEQKARQNADKQSLQAEQSALQQGVQQAAKRLNEAGQKSSLLSPRAQRAMTDAQKKVDQATRDLANARQSDQAAGSMQEASEALNQTAATLVRDRERAQNASSASGFQEMLEQLKDMAQQQGSLNSQTAELIPRPGAQLDQQGREQARQLGRQQREVASSLEEMSDQDRTGKADELAKEARQLAQALESGALDPNVIDRQQRLFRRMLDAGRTLERDEREDNGKREAKAATGNELFLPPNANASGKAASKFAMPNWNDLRGLTPEERRLVLDYFKRINAEKP